MNITRIILDQAKSASGFLNWDDGESLINLDELPTAKRYSLRFNFSYSDDSSQLEVMMANKPKVSNNPSEANPAKKLGKKPIFCSFHGTLLTTIKF